MLAGWLTCVPMVSVMAAEYSSQAHDALVTDQAPHAREKALEAFAAWLRPGELPAGAARERVVADYAALLSREGRHREALNAANDANFVRLPDYALDALFYSARVEADTPYLASIVSLAEQRAPNASRTRVWRAFLSFDTGDLPEARRRAQAVADDSTAPATLRASASELVGAVNEREGDWMGALRAYDRAVSLDPELRSARRAATWLLVNERAAPEAYTQALAANERARAAGQPALYGELEIASLWQQSIGQRTSWAVGQRDVVNGVHRHEALNAVLADSSAWLDQHGASPDPEMRAIRERVLVDRIGALNGRGYYRDSTDLYEALVAEGVDVPYYGLTPAADSYAQQRRSDIAVLRYEEALQKAGDRLPIPSDAHIGLVYAYLDIGRFGDAEAWLDVLEAQTPPFLRLAPIDSTPNPQYTDVQELRARYMLYTDQPRASEPLLRGLHARAPFNASLGESVSRVTLLRDQPHASLAQAQLTLADHPDSIPARTAYADALLGTGRIREGSREIDLLDRDYSELGAVRRVTRDRDVLYAPVLRVDATAGWGSGNNTLSNRDWRVDTRLESGLVNDHWRLFARHVAGYGDAANGTGRRNRTGVGAMIGRGPWTAEAEAHTGDGARRHGVAAGLGFRPTDHWMFGLSWDTNTVELPWRAYNAGVAASRGEARAAYQVNESRRFDLAYQHVRFSDDNVNQAVGASWTERWVSGPISQFQTTLGVGASKNRLGNVAYFSPSSDKSVDLTARYQWLTWKRDDRFFLQRIYGTVGSYAQSGYSASATYGARYEHEWRFHRSVVVTYGVGINYHPYDGRRERRTLGYLNLVIPFL